MSLFKEPPYVCEGFTYAPQVDDQDDDGRYYFTHKVVRPDGRKMLMPMRSYNMLDKDEFEAWAHIGGPDVDAAKLLVSSECFDIGELEWLADIAKAHNVAPGDWQTLAILARLYGTESPETQQCSS